MRPAASVRWLSALALAALLGGCAAMQAKALLDASAVTDRLTAQEAYTKINGVLIEQGFDVKHGDPAAGLITTEYKPLGTSIPIGGGRATELFLQIRTTVTDQGGGKLAIKLVPTVREVDRQDRSRVADRPLKYWSEKGMDLVEDTSDDRPWVQGELLFGRVTRAVAEACGLAPEQFPMNVAPLP